MTGMFCLSNYRYHCYKCNAFLHLFHYSLGTLGVLEDPVTLGYPIREYESKEVNVSIYRTYFYIIEKA